MRNIYQFWFKQPYDAIDSENRVFRTTAHNSTEARQIFKMAYPNAEVVTWQQVCQTCGESKGDCLCDTVKLT